MAVTENETLTEWVEENKEGLEKLAESDYPAAWVAGELLQQVE